MELETLLLNAMLEAGASPSLAAEFASEHSLDGSTRIRREKDNQRIVDMFYKTPRPKLARELGVNRSTIYRRARKLLHRAIALATTTEETVSPREA